MGYPEPFPRRANRAPAVQALCELREVRASLQRVGARVAPWPPNRPTQAMVMTTPERRAQPSNQAVGKTKFFSPPSVPVSVQAHPPHAWPRTCGSPGWPRHGLTHPSHPAGAEALRGRGDEHPNPPGCAQPATPAVASQVMCPCDSQLGAVMAPCEDPKSQQVAGSSCPLAAEEAACLLSGFPLTLE